MLRAMLEMNKLDIAALKAAYTGKTRHEPAHACAKSSRGGERRGPEALAARPSPPGGRYWRLPSDGYLTT